MIRATNVKRGTIAKEGLVRVRPDAIPAGRDPFLRTGDIIVVRSGAYTGDVGLITPEWEGAVAGYDLVFSPNRDVLDSQFCSCCLLSGEVQSHFHGEKDRAAQAHLNRQQLENTTIPMPALPEQRANAGVLRTVQRAKEATEKVLAATKQLKQSLLRHLFTYGPVPFDQADQVELKETEIGPLPEHWSLRKLGDVARIGNGSTPKRTNPAYWDNGTIPWLTSGKIHEVTIRQADEFVTPIAQTQCHLPVVKTGSVLVAITGQGKTLGNAAQVKFDTCVSQHLAYIQFPADAVLPEFALRFLHTQYRHFRDVAGGGGSTKGALTCAFLKSYPVQVAPVDEQRLVTGTLAAVDSKVAAESIRLVALEVHFNTLLHHLMTGKVRVHNADPSAVREAH